MAKILVRIKKNSGTYQKEFWYVSKRIPVRIKKNSGTHQNYFPCAARISIVY